MRSALINSGRTILSIATIATATAQAAVAENPQNRNPVSISQNHTTIVAPTIDSTRSSKESEDQQSEISLDFSLISNSYDVVEKGKDFAAPAVNEPHPAGDTMIPDEKEESSSVSSDLTTSIVEESQFSVISEVIGSSAVEELHRQPMSEAELNGAIETLRSGEQAIGRIVPPQLRPFNPVLLSNIFEEVAEMLHKSNLTETARLNIERRKASQLVFDNHEDPTSPRSPPPLLVPEVASPWAELAQRCPCHFCKDVLCAPALLPCSHTFCFHCIESLYGQITGPEVSPCCPTCHAPIHRQELYERTLDHRVLDDVEKVPDCETKRKWAERRRISLCKIENRQRSSQQRINSNSSHNDTSDNGFSGWLNSYWTQAVIGVAVLVIFVVLKVRVK